MANQTRTGFWPAKIQGNQVAIMRFPITTSSGAAIYRGDVVVNNADGGVRRAAADSGTTQVGVVVALYDTNGVPIGDPRSLVSTKYMTANVAGYADVALALPNTIFEAYAGTSSNLTSEAVIFASADHVNTAGSTTTAVSGHVLNGTALNTEANFQILGLVPKADNAWGDSCGVYVRFLESMWGQVNPSAGV